MGWTRRALLSLLMSGAVALAASTARAAPAADLWEKWAAFDAASTRSVDHAAWDGFLKTYVKARPDGLNRVDYGAVTGADKAVLSGYLAWLSATPVANLNRAEQQAFWINLYNALTVKVVLDHFPVASIMDISISPGLFSKGPWGKKLIAVDGEPVSLDDIEHRILRPIWKDPRQHYAVNCASVGCPDLIARAYRPDDMDAVLTANARAYINSSRGVRIDGGKLVVSKIYDWFQADFGGNETGVLDHLRKYADGSTKAALEQARGIDDYDYDWRLNGL